MGKYNFQYDETGNTYYYVFLTFLGLVLIPATSYFWPNRESDPDKKKLYASIAARDSDYGKACIEKVDRVGKKRPWAQTKRYAVRAMLIMGWMLFAMVIYQVS